MSPISNSRLQKNGERFVCPAISQQVKVGRSFFVPVQYESPRIPTLRNMVRHINGYHSSEASHGE
jgi:hypothetical protein